MNWYTRRRSLKPSLTSWTKPSPKCPDTKKQQPHCVHFTTNKLRQQATRPVVSPQQENSAGVSTVRNPLLRLHSSILFLPETRADNVPKNISFYFSSFLWDRVKKQTLQSKEINHAINQGPPPYPPTTKSRSCVYLMKMSQISPA